MIAPILYLMQLRPIGIKRIYSKITKLVSGRAIIANQDSDFRVYSLTSGYCQEHIKTEILS